MKTLKLALFFIFFISYANAQTVHVDKPFIQDYSIKYFLPKDAKKELLRAYTDRNGLIKVSTSDGILQPHNGRFLYAGELVSDQTYRTIANKKIHQITKYKNQFIMLDDKTIFSNAWAGKIFIPHELPNARLVEGGNDFDFMISDGQNLHYITNSKTVWKHHFEEKVIEIRHQKHENKFWILTSDTLFSFDTETKQIRNQFSGNNFTAFDFSNQPQKLIIGTTNGYLEFDTKNSIQVGEKHIKLPCTEITSLTTIGDRIWFGTTNGAFATRADGRFDYYHGKRWLPSNSIKHISAGANNNVLILTDVGLAEINFKTMTLHEKAMFFEEQVRSRHIRNGFNATLSGMEKGNLSTGYLSDSDNDGLWTAMYLGAETFRYALTKDKNALENCRESLEAMERLFSINPVAGFPARSFERSGYIDKLADPERWQHSPNTEWDWKSTTSSDEAIGHVFAYGVMAELIDDPSLKKRAIVLLDTLMSHILKNNWYLIDYDGKPTTWGRWNPEYVNAFPTNVGDRKLNSSNIIAMLQTAYYFTKKTKYKEKAFELMQKHGYFKNLMRPMNQIGYAPKDADEHSKKMSDAWNHSDDEMYFLGYWGLYRYAFNDTLKKHYKNAIVDHFEAERPEKEGLWNIFTAITRTPDFDLKEAIWYLQEHPLDMIDWAIENSHRKDIVKIETNFRNQTIKEVLPPDERPIQRHNTNMFELDRTKPDGTSEHSAGDIWLLPYWLGRYLGVISAASK